MGSEGRTTEDAADATVSDDPTAPSPEFCRRVLDTMPGALLIVDPTGTVIYGNRALSTLTGHTLEAGHGRSVMDYVHPDDHAWLIDAFVGVTESIFDGSAVRGIPLPNEDTEMEATPWASISFRMITASGETLPVEVSGLSGLHDPIIGGLLYDVRPAAGQELMRRVLAGLGTKEPVESLLRMVLDMLAMRPLDLEAVILESKADGSFVPLVSTSAPLFELVKSHDGPAPWDSTSSVPSYVDIVSLEGSLGDGLCALGHLDMWHVSVGSSMMSTTYRIVVSSPERQIPSTGTLFRIQRAAELAGIVLFRSHADELLHHAATHDALTRLPNRAGFYSRINRSMQSSPIAVLYIDVDGLKPINDLHGHHAGDVVLQKTADRITSAIRPIDYVARLGGDEFAVVFHGDPDSTEIDMDRVQEIASTLLAEAGRPISINNGKVQISASIGITVTNSPVAVDYLLSRADAAMYEAKRDGGNQSRIANLFRTKRAA